MGEGDFCFTTGFMKRFLSLYKDEALICQRDGGTSRAWALPDEPETSLDLILVPLFAKEEDGAKYNL